MVGYDLKKAQKNAASIGFGYSVKASTKKDKKLDIYQNGKKLGISIKSDE